MTGFDLGQSRRSVLPLIEELVHADLVLYDLIHWCFRGQASFLKTIQFDRGCELSVLTDPLSPGDEHWMLVLQKGSHHFPEASFEPPEAFLPTFEPFSASVANAPLPNAYGH